MDCGYQTRYLQTWIHATYASRYVSFVNEACHNFLMLKCG